MIALLAFLLAGETYLTQEQALKLVFPNGEAVLERTVDLDATAQALVAKRYGSAVAARQRVFVGVKDGKAAGYAMILTEITKTLPATFIVGIDAKGEVTEVAVMSHEDHIGTDCRRRRFVEQFEGKKNDDRIRVGSGGGIINVSGATLSCIAVARAVRMAVAIVQHHFVERPENVRAVLQEPEPVRQKRYLMGTFCTITAYGDAGSVEKAFDEIKRLEKVLSNYDEKSELSKLNRQGRIKASADLLAFVKESKRYGELSDGAFDITVAPLMRLWGFKDGKYRVPEPREIEEALKKVGSRRIEIDGDEVRLSGGMELDPGGIGKGIAVDRAADVLRKAGIKRALVDFGSSVVALEDWEIAIRDPFRDEKVLGTVRLKDESLSTSGSYEKFFKLDGRTYCHILDPRTGRPVEGVVSVSVIAPTATESDGLDTGVFVSGKLPEKLPALLVTDKGEQRTNAAFAERLKKGVE